MTLKEARKKANLSQHGLETLSSITQAQISRIENGEYFPIQATRDKLEKALKVKVDWVQTRMEGKKYRGIWGDDIGLEESTFKTINDYIKSGVTREEQKKRISRIKKFIKLFDNNYINNK